MAEYLFLLGGHDLEMCEIKKILQEQNQAFVDQELSWGAKLSDYREYLGTDKTIVAIELIQDIEIPANFITIDHHNDLPPVPTAIEQVAKLLQIELTAYQKLVAINDVEHIKGLKKAAVSNAVIQEIRAKDRMCQGVTEEDEALAIASIESKREINGVTVINAKTDKFSAITDRLDVLKLLIYTNSKLNYYGQNRDRLIIKYQKLIDEQKAYFGGGEDGYFGFSKEVLTVQEIQARVEEIIACV